MCGWVPVCPVEDACWRSEEGPWWGYAADTRDDAKDKIAMGVGLSFAKLHSRGWRIVRCDVVKAKAMPETKPRKCARCGKPSGPIWLCPRCEKELGVYPSQGPRDREGEGEMMMAKKKKPDPSAPLPCPFCGAAPEIISWHGHPEKTVSCENNECPAHPYVSGYTLGEAVSAWNGRTP